MPVKIKFCGITREQDAQAAVACGADAIGFVFHPASARYVAPQVARQIARDLPPFLCKVGLFVNVTSGEIARVVDLVGLDIVQFHGDEAPAECARSPRPWIKALRVAPGLDLAAACARYSAASAWLFDTYDASLYGGTGRAFDWRRIPTESARPVILAGGLTVENVAGAIAAARPYAVDTSGGIEAAKGIKDRDKMQRFVAEVRRIEGAG